MTESCSNASLSTSSSLNSSVPDTEDDQIIASILAEDETNRVDTRLGKRLSHLDSIPHTPRINGEIPNVNDATLDHERLSERLATYGLAELQIEGDGNCQNLIATKLGVQRISGITVFDKTEKKTFDPLPDLEIQIESNGSKSISKVQVQLSKAQVQGPFYRPISSRPFAAQLRKSSPIQDSCSNITAKF